eukprot:TRINITY_DN54529_c0_g1_i1.p1 TRINITY_DN54529_c0_g1~~TRINITY_DN54529_c0_g1_i1.p1  ORF type:complete len:590 (+),score=48.94 TRINITY_DN54529_c0_g1_i1:96-1772(+)
MPPNHPARPRVTVAVPDELVPAFPIAQPVPAAQLQPQPQRQPIPCRSFVLGSVCRFGASCRFLHERLPCTAGSSCSRPDCTFDHPTMAPPAAHPMGGTSNETRRQAQPASSSNRATTPARSRSRTRSHSSRAPRAAVLPVEGEQSKTVRLTSSEQRLLFSACADQITTEYGVRVGFGAPDAAGCSEATVCGRPTALEVFWEATLPDLLANPGPYIARLRCRPLPHEEFPVSRELALAIDPLRISSTLQLKQAGSENREAYVSVRLDLADPNKRRIYVEGPPATLDMVPGLLTSDITATWALPDVFVDNSNVIHGLQHVLGKDGMPRATPATRVNIQRLIETVFRRPVVDLPPVADGARGVVWASRPADGILRCWQDYGFTTHAEWRAANRGEQLVDDALQNTLRKHLNQSALRGRLTGTMILLSGDGNDNGGRGGFPEVVEEFIAAGWRVEVWGWSAGMSRTYWELAERFPTLAVHLLDRHWDFITFQERRPRPEPAREPAPRPEPQPDTPVCLLCDQAPATHVAVPCGHKLYCATCTAVHCVKCNQRVESYIRSRML